jgi:glutamate-1-semialdehyde 2,1-aminomutase
MAPMRQLNEDIIDLTSQRVASGLPHFPEATAARVTPREPVTKTVGSLAESKRMQERLRALIPGGAHTYAKAWDQYPEDHPGVIVRGRGCHVWDADGNEYIEYGMGLRSVTLGHAYAPVIDAVRESLALGTNFTRPAAMELECAEKFLELVPFAEMVKFTKDGSTANTAALKLARKHTGRELVAICGDHPFFSYDDWFMVTTTMDGGTQPRVRAETLRFDYNDADSLRALFAAHPGEIAAVFMEPSRTIEPAPGFLQSVRALCDQHGAVLVFDEVITGFRWHRSGAHALYGVTPDLATFGKALANGFSVSALCGKRELMTLGSRDRDGDDVFLLSTTHGAEVPGLAAAIATMQVYQREPVIEHLHRQGERLRSGIAQAIKHHGLSPYIDLLGRGCNLLYGTRGPDRQPSQLYRALFLQQTLQRGVLMPSLITSYSHTDADVDRTIDVVAAALGVYALVLSEGIHSRALSRPTRHVFDRR